MLMMGLSFTFPSLSLLTLPSLVVVGLTYGLKVGPGPNILISTLFTQKMKCGKEKYNFIFLVSPTGWREDWDGSHILQYQL